jgi:hypothetical protein
MITANTLRFDDRLTSDAGRFVNGHSLYTNGAVSACP